MRDEARLEVVRRQAAPAIRLCAALREVLAMLQADASTSDMKRAFSRRMGLSWDTFWRERGSGEEGYAGLPPDSPSSWVFESCIGGDSAHERFFRAMEHLGSRQSKDALEDIPDLDEALRAATVGPDGGVSIRFDTHKGFRFEVDEQ